MNKNILIILLSLFLMSSCASGDDKEMPSVVGEWRTIERIFYSDDEEFNNRINSLLKEDDRLLVVKRDFDETLPGSGIVKTSAQNKETGLDVRSRRGEYEMKRDTLYILDEVLGSTKSAFSLGETVLITRTPVTKKELDRIIDEIGGDPRLVPVGITGELKVREIR